MKNIYLEIKWAYQRVRYGYDETMKWCFQDYFHQFIIPLKEFCKEELKEEHIANGNNPEHKKIFEKTLKLIAKYDMWDDKSAQNLWSYVRKNIRYYWN